MGQFWKYLKRAASQLYLETRVTNHLWHHLPYKCSCRVDLSGSPYLSPHDTDNYTGRCVLTQTWSLKRTSGNIVLRSTCFFKEVTYTFLCRLKQSYGEWRLWSITLKLLQMLGRIVLKNLWCQHFYWEAAMVLFRPSALSLIRLTFRRKENKILSYFTSRKD